ncbi:hypothetical protein QF001_000554 [Paraburkholderia youngii]
MESLRQSGCRFYRWQRGEVCFIQCLVGQPGIRPVLVIPVQVSVRIYGDRLDCYLSGVLVHSTARDSRAHDNRHALDYRHFIDALKRKSQAFKGLAFRDALFPREAYRRTWEQRDARLSQRDACKTMVSLLELAGLHGVGPYWQGSFMRTTTTPLGRSRIQCPRWCEF